MLCKVEGCSRPHKANGYCGMHNARYKRHGHTESTVIWQKCCVEGCEIKTVSKHCLCTKHYKQQWYLENIAKRDQLIKRTSQEKWIHSSNLYVMIKVDGKLVYEHRVLAEKALGRPLPEGAVVHHTGNPWDNHGLFKLVICPDQVYHKLIHKRMKVFGYENN